jgi:hypothetical protein
MDAVNFINVPGHLGRADYVSEISVVHKQITKLDYMTESLEPEGRDEISDCSLGLYLSCKNALMPVC